MTDLAARLREVIEERLRVARAASVRDEYATSTGEHWQWECSNCDTVLAITPVTLLDEYLQCPACDRGSVALRSVEQYPTRSVGPLPHFVVNYADEQRVADALYIALNDPADAILAAEWALGVLERHRPQPDEPTLCSVCFHGGLDYGDYGFRWPCDDIRILAKRYGIEVE